MEFVIFKTGGKQYKAKIGDVIEVDKLPQEINTKLELSDVLLWVGEGSTKIGKPTVDGARVNALVLEQKKGEKIRVAKFKAKARYRKVMGFRALRTTLRIDGFDIPGAKQAKEAKKTILPKPTKTKSAVKKK